MSDQEYLQEEINLRDYINVIIKRKMIILAIFFVSVIIAGIVSFLIPKEYQTSAIIKIGSVSEILISKPEAMLMLESREFSKSAIRRFDINSSGLRKIEIEDIPNTNFIRLNIQHTDSDLAVGICEAMGNLFILKGKEIYDKRVAFLNEQIQELKERSKVIEKQIYNINQTIVSQAKEVDSALLKNTLANYEGIYNTLKREEYLLKERLSNSREFEFFESPLKPESPIRSRIKLNIAISGTLGLMLGVFVAFFQEFWQKEKSKKS